MGLLGSFNSHDSFEITTRGIKTMIQRLSRESGVKFSAHAFRRGMAIHNLKQGLSTRVVQTLERMGYDYDGGKIFG